MQGDFLLLCGNEADVRDAIDTKYRLRHPYTAVPIYEFFLRAQLHVRLCRNGQKCAKLQSPQKHLYQRVSYSSYGKFLRKITSCKGLKINFG